MPNYDAETTTSIITKLLPNREAANAFVDKYMSGNGEIKQKLSQYQGTFGTAASIGSTTGKISSPSSSSTTFDFGDPFKAFKGVSKIAEMTDDDRININNPLFELNKQIQRESDLQTEINEKIGLTGELSEKFRASIIQSVPNAKALGYSFQNVVDLVTEMNTKSGRFNLLSKESLDASYAVARSFVGDLRNLSDYFNEFEKIGLGARDAMDSIARAGRASLSLGLNSKETTKALKENLGKINEYGFQNGVDGLNRMVQKSIEFRTSMYDVFKIAENVMDPEKAIALTANLQVLGGAIGDFNDPLKLMYMATNNVEGLQDALIGAASSLATFNQEQGRFEITGINQRRLHEMATQLGVDYKELSKTAIAAQERTLANNELLAKGLQISDKDREFITNMSQMKGGEMTITIPDDVAKAIGSKTEISLRDLTSQQVEQLKGMRDRLEEKSPLEIAKGQFTAMKQIELYVQGLYSQIVTGAKAVAVGGPGVSNPMLRMNDFFNGLLKTTELTFGAASAKTPEFRKTIEDWGTNIGGMLKDVMEPAADIMGAGVEDLRSKMIPDLQKALGVTTNQLLSNINEKLDPYKNSSSPKNSRIDGGIKYNLTIKDHTSNGVDAYMNQSSKEYLNLTRNP